mgnify:CR=1 FL=1
MLKGVQVNTEGSVLENVSCTAGRGYGCSWLSQQSLGLKVFVHKNAQTFILKKNGTNGGVRQLKINLDAVRSMDCRV